MTQANMTTADLQDHTMFNALNMKAMRKSKTHKGSVVVSTVHAVATFRNAADHAEFIGCFGTVEEVRGVVKKGFVELAFSSNGKDLRIEATCYSLPGLHQNTAVVFADFLRRYGKNMQGGRMISTFTVE